MILYNADAVVVLPQIESDSLDSLVTDPPAGISFMNKEWDKPTDFIKDMTAIYQECLRVLKPGAHGLVWAIPRTSHWTATALEQAGFEIRDKILHLFGQGFPKSINLEKHIDKQKGLCECDLHEKNKAKTNMPDMQSGVHAKEQDCPEQSEILQCHMLRSLESKQSQDIKTPCEDSSIRSKGMDYREPIIGECENDGRTESSMEGWPLHRDGQGLCDDSQPETSESKEQRICVRTHSCDGESLGSEFDEERSGSPHKSQDGRQPNRESETICDAQRALARTSQSRLHCGECGKVKREAVAGLGSALKPAVEEWILIRKPLGEATVAKNVLKHGTGGLNIDESRVLSDGNRPALPITSNTTSNTVQGRFPSNLVLSHNEDCQLAGCSEGCAVAMLDEQSGILKSGEIKPYKNNGGWKQTSEMKTGTFESSHGGASRFFYCAKASRKDRGEGNVHPTVKSTKLMEYLIRLITPPQGTVLDPFMGSGSTGVAAKNLGFDFVGIEREAEYYEIASNRLK